MLKYSLSYWSNDNVTLAEISFSGECHRTVTKTRNLVTVPEKCHGDNTSRSSYDIPIEIYKMIVEPELCRGDGTTPLPLSLLECHISKNMDVLRVLVFMKLH